MKTTGLVLTKICFRYKCAKSPPLSSGLLRLGSSRHTTWPSYRILSLTFPHLPVTPPPPPPPILPPRLHQQLPLMVSSSRLVLSPLHLPFLFFVVLFFFWMCISRMGWQVCFCISYAIWFWVAVHCTVSGFFCIWSGFSSWSSLFPFLIEFLLLRT